MLFFFLLFCFCYFSSHISDSYSCFPNSVDSSHLTYAQRSIISYQLSRGYSPEDVIQEWDIEYHKRTAPSIQTIYKIKRQILNGESVEPQKTGPKEGWVLTQQVLTKIEEVIEENEYITLDCLNSYVGLPRSTTYYAIKKIEMKQFNAPLSPELTKTQMLQRVSFCETFLKWNVQYMMRVWWSDESSFSLEKLLRHQRRKYWSKKKKSLFLDKLHRQSSVNVWAAIRGDGRVIYAIVSQNQNAEKYIELMTKSFVTMEPTTSFLMQDGASFHKGNDAVKWLEANWKDRWIGLRSPRLEFPPRSMDLTPMDFSFWNYVKGRVSAKEPKTTEELRRCIIEVMDDIPSIVVTNMCMGVKERLRKCLANNGGRFEGGVQG